MSATHTWLAAYLYYEQPWETFLVQAVKPFVEQVYRHAGVAQYFFIRYWERGPHIRLRFKGQEDCLQREVKPALEAYFGRYFAQNPAPRHDPPWTAELPADQRWFPNHSVQFIPYEPELERYGGPASMLIAEKQFECSSRAVLSLLPNGDNWRYERALGAAIQLHLGLARAMEMDLQEAKLFFSYIAYAWEGMAFRPQPDISKQEAQENRRALLHAFGESFARQKETLTHYHQAMWQALDGGNGQPEWLACWLHDMAATGRQLRAAQAKGELLLPQIRPNPDFNVSPEHQQLWPLLESYVHMTNNRLGILNRDEAYLGYLIKNSLDNISENGA